MVDVPTQDGATAADLLKELENAVSLELRSHDLLKETLVVPKTALWREISMHLTHGYYLFAHGTHPSISANHTKGHELERELVQC